MIIFEHPDPRPVNRIQHALRDPAPAVANIGPALEAWTPRPLYFRGRKILPRPVEWDDGVALLKAAAGLEEWAKSDDGFEELRARYGRVVELCWTCARPRWVPRWVQRRRRNPFRRATEAEIKELLHFFGRCRTISLVGHRS
jgi:hypothetical protein